MVIAYSQATEHFGSSRKISTSSSFNVSLPRGPGGYRFLLVDVTSPGVAATLPSSVVASGRVQYVIAVHAASAESLDIQDADSNLIVTLSPGEAAQLIYTGDEWISRTSTLGEGTALDLDRKSVELTIPANIYTDFDLQEFVDNLDAWDREQKVALVITMAPGSVFGASTTSTYGFTTNEWPAGSTLLLVQPETAYVVGAGGAGGRGSDQGTGLLAIVGAPGGTAMRVQLNTNVVRYGVVGGGGGGGGGGARTTGASAAPGGGGGGGAGQHGGSGAAGGTGATGAGPSGASGLLLAYGRGGGVGSNRGGNGGSLGTAGETRGAAGGAAGNAVEYDTAISYTEIRSGTRYGAIVAV